MEDTVLYLPHLQFTLSRVSKKGAVVSLILCTAMLAPGGSSYSTVSPPKDDGKPGTLSWFDEEFDLKGYGLQPTIRTDDNWKNGLEASFQTFVGSLDIGHRTLCTFIQPDGTACGPIELVNPYTFVRGAQLKREGVVQAMMELEKLIKEKVPTGLITKDRRFFGYKGYNLLQPHPKHNLAQDGSDNQQRFPDHGKAQEMRTCVIPEKDIRYVCEEHPGLGIVLKEGGR